MKTRKQQKIIEFLMTHETMTKNDAMGLIDDYYCNGAKHVGDILSRMVKRGFIERIKPGLFKRGTTKTVVRDFKDPNQLDLF